MGQPNCGDEGAAYCEREASTSSMRLAVTFFCFLAVTAWAQQLEVFGEPRFIQTSVSRVERDESCAATNADFCVISATLYDGMVFNNVFLSMDEFPAEVTSPTFGEPNPYYGATTGCQNGYSIFNPSMQSCPLFLTGTWDGADHEVRWAGDSPCPLYTSASDAASITVPVSTLSFRGLEGTQVTGRIQYTSIDQTVWEDPVCCGCCIEVADPQPPKFCDVPIDFNAEILEDLASGALTQQGFIPFQVNNDSPTAARLNDTNGMSGLEYEVITGRNGWFNNVFQNSFPATPNLLLLDGLADDQDADYVGVRIHGLQEGSYTVRVWVFDQDSPDLGPQNFYWATNGNSNPFVVPDRNNVTAGPFAPQPPVYDPTLALLDNPGTPAGTFTVYADGTSSYQLLAMADGCPPVATDCKTRFNGFRLTLMDVTPPVLSCQDVTVDATSCQAESRWCGPTSISDNCALNPVGFNTIVQTSGPAQGMRDIGTYEVGYAGVDLSSNTGTCSFNLVVADVLAPSLTGCVQDFTTETTDGCFATPTWDNPPANTNCDDALTYTYTPFSSGDPIPVGTHDMTLVVSDNVGRSDSCSFEVTVTDGAVPDLCVPPQDVTLPCGPSFQQWLSNTGFARTANNCPFASADSSCICDTNITSSFEQTAVGNVTVTVLGGRPPYLFAYNQSGLPALFPVVQNSTELSLSGLASGLYSFVITDVNLFITTLCVTVSSP